MTAPAPHLGLEDLIAGLDNAPMDDAAQTHLSSCPHCRTEAARWRTAADGVRTLVGSCAAPPWQSVDIFAAPGGPRAGRPRRLRSSRPNTLRRRHMLAICTVALALMIGAAFEIGALTSPNSPNPPEPASAVPTASGAPGAYGIGGVASCSGLEVATGSLGAVAQGSTLELTATGSAPISVQTSGSTSVMREAYGSVSDIANGEHAVVRGSTSGGTITPSAVGIAPAGSDSVPIPAVRFTIPGPGDTTASGQRAAVPGLAVTSGTVENVSGSGFTLVTASGSDPAVTMSAATPVVELTDSTVQDLQAGYTTAVVGTLSSDGTLVAESVVQAGPGIGTGSPQTNGPVEGTVQVPGGVMSFSGWQCSPSRIALQALVASP